MIAYELLCDVMADRMFLVVTRAGMHAAFLVVGARIEQHGEHLVLLSADGTMAGLFLEQDIERVIELGGQTEALAKIPNLPEPTLIQ